VPHDRPTRYLTTAIPYINAQPHLGHILEWYQADALARYFRDLKNETVELAAGADENSLKNVQAAEKAGIAPQEWLDQYAKVFEETYAFFGIELTRFRRSSDQKLHWPGVQKLWQACVERDDIYKKSYEGWYCLGCEAFYTPDELVDGKCPEHLTVPEQVTEENYFFRLSKYQAQIEKLLASDEVKIVSDAYKNEMLSFVRRGLEDFSVSRPASRGRGVGVPVPGDETQVIYVWYDALTVYLTAIGYGFDQELFESIWPATAHVIGKGINRFHSVYWIGMLLSAGLPLPKQVVVHGYLTLNGQKMSKSLGNVIDPKELAETVGVEALRYYLLKEIPSHADGDVSVDRLKEIYTADLVNGYGNLCSRLAKMASTSDVEFAIEEPRLNTEFEKLCEATEFELAGKWCHAQLQELDRFLNEQQPWKQTGDAKHATLQQAINTLVMISFHLQPFLPETTKRILTHFRQPKIEALTPLFPRLPHAD
jgi:methionyl-tRNA synthetase